MIWLELLFFIIGLFLLVKGSDFFVKSAASLARKFGVSEFIIGLTLVALGTSLPELISAIFASIRHESGLIIGNIVGANIANIALIIGIASIIGVVQTKKDMLQRDGYIMILAFVLLFIFMWNNSITRIEGIVFVLLFVAYTMFLLETKGLEGYRLQEFARYFFRFRYLITINSKIFSNMRKATDLSADKRKIIELFNAGIFKDIVILGISGFFIYIGADYLINGAVYFANFFNVPQMMIGIIMSIGTTFPELSVAISAARRNYGNIIIGNAVGSCITNTFLILGTASLIFPMQILNVTKLFTVPFMIFIGFLFLIFIKETWQVRREQGIILLFFYALFLAILFFSGIAA